LRNLSNAKRCATYIAVFAKNGDTTSQGAKLQKKVSRRQYFFEQHLSAQEPFPRVQSRQINCLMTTAARM
jgi:hypothetical protein